MTAYEQITNLPPPVFTTKQLATIRALAMAQAKWLRVVQSKLIGTARDNLAVDIAEMQGIADDALL